MVEESGRRFQVRLLDLVVVVVGASYVLDVARRSRLAWGGGPPDLAHTIGLTVLTFGVAVGLVALGQWVRRLRDRGHRGWSLLWRVLALGWLAGAVVEVAAALQVAQTTPVVGLFGNKASMMLRLTAVTTAVGMVGLILALSPVGGRPARPRPRLGSWPSLLLAALAGVMLLGLAHGMIPYLVLIAMEAVHNALRRAPLVARPGLFDRMALASLEALPGLLGCLATAAWVDDELRSAARDPADQRRPRSWRGMIARATTVALAAGGSAYSLLVSIPKLSPTLAEGLADVVDGPAIASVALGFSVLAFGFAARASAHLATGLVDRPDAPSPPRRRLGPWPRRITVGLVALVCLEITAAATQAFLRDLEYRWYIPVGLDTWGKLIEAPWRWLNVPTTSYGWFMVFERPDDFLIGAAALWLAIRIWVLISSKDSTPPAIDAFAADRLARGRFLGWWVALAISMVASLPGLGLVAMTVIHLAIRWSAQ